MAIDLKETLLVGAPIDAVWRFMTDPEGMATCIPGAKLEEVVDERNFRASIQVKVGPISTRYQGRVEFTGLNDQSYEAQMVAEGRETGGGTARGTISSRLRSLGDGQTEIVTEASVELTGRIVQVGRGMIQGVSHQLFQQFAARTKQRLESPEGSPESTGESEAEPLRLGRLVLRALWLPILRFVRRLLRRPTT
jgi:carbon monoxide dehydrogenase subunit G